MNLSIFVIFPISVSVSASPLVPIPLCSLSLRSIHLNLHLSLYRAGSLHPVLPSPLAQSSAACPLTLHRAQIYNHSFSCHTRISNFSFRQHTLHPTPTPSSLFFLFPIVSFTHPLPSTLYNLYSFSLLAAYNLSCCSIIMIFFLVEISNYQSYTHPALSLSLSLSPHCPHPHHTLAISLSPLSLPSLLFDSSRPDQMQCCILIFSLTACLAR